MKPSNTTTSGKATDMIAGMCALPPLPCPCTKRHVMLNLTSTGVCNIGSQHYWVQLASLINMAVDVVAQNLQKVTSTNIRKNISYVVTPRCAPAVISAVVLRRPTKEYTHPYSMMHRRLPTAGIEVARHYHQLLVIPESPIWTVFIAEKFVISKKLHTSQ